MWSNELQSSERQEVFNTLVTFGMKNKNLNWNEIADRCRYIESKPLTAAQRTPVIVGLIEWKLENEQPEKTPQIIKSICQFKIFPVMKKPEHFPIPWHGDKFAVGQLISCEEGYMKNSKNLVGCSYPIIDDRQLFVKKDFKAKKALGLAYKNIANDTVVRQLIELINLTNEQGNVDFTDQEKITSLREIYRDSVSFLNTNIKNNSANIVEIQQLTQKKCILLEKKLQFVLPSQCALCFEHSLDSLSPYLAEVSQDMSKNHQEFLLSVGVRETFKLNDYIEVLNKIRDHAQGNVLSTETLQLTVHIITKCLYNTMNVTGSIKSKKLFAIHPDIPVPNASGILSPARMLCYSDTAWLELERVNFCHAFIPRIIADGLGLETVRENVLDENELSYNFGQKERLVKRIKRILEGYSCDEDILKEMLQNADDAGATEIQFILDPRSLPTEKIIANTLKHLQGPALCVYNNKSFTMHDLEGIQSLGEGTKSDDPTKTGQYGVGFNCVYHLTDIPTFLTNVKDKGIVLCIFDPNCKYAPKASVSNPGRMYKVDELKDKFTDGFKGYLQEVLDVTNSGTMFRLPLRNQEMQEQSEISKEIINVQKVLQMFEKFKKDMVDSVLFLNNITKISLGQVEETPNGIVLKNIYAVNVEMSREATIKKANFQSHTQEMAAKLKCEYAVRKSLNEVLFEEVDYEVSTKDSNDQIGVWHIVQRFGFENSDDISPDIITASRRGDIGFLPRGGVAYLKLHNSKEKKPTKGRLFCFLPLPVSVEFPVHINGHFALAHESRRSIFADELCTDIRAKWNKCVIMGIIAPAYTTLISLIRLNVIETATFEDFKNRIQQYFDMFPQISQSSSLPYNEELTKEIYVIIGRNNMFLLPLLPFSKDIKLIKWHGPLGSQNHQTYFDDLFKQVLNQASRPTYRSSGFILRQVANEPEQPKQFDIIRKTLTRCGFSMFNCNIRICENFEKAKVNVKRVSPKVVLDFLSTYNKKATQCKIKNLPVKLVESAYKNWQSFNALLEYCCREPRHKDLLPGLPLLVTHDDMVRTFDTTFARYIVNSTEIADQVPDIFIHRDVSSTLELNSKIDVALCQVFTVQAFSDVLPRILPKNTFFGLDKNIPLKILEEHLKISNISTWLVNVWSFLASLQPNNALESGKQLISDTSTTNAPTSNLEFIYPVFEWCLLPIFSNKKESLLPLSRASEVIAHDIVPLHQEISKNLDKIGIKRPITSCIYPRVLFGVSSNIFQLMKDLLGSIDKPETVLRSLGDLLEHDEQVIIENLGIAEGLNILSYFSKSIESSNHIFDDCKTIFKKLPFYETIYNKKTSLHRSDVFVLPQKIPKNGLESWTQSQSIIFLKENSDISSLVNYLGCKELSVTDVYCKFIFTQFSILSPDAQRVHMDFVKNYVKKLKDKDDKTNSIELHKMHASLGNLCFIPDSTTDLLFPAHHFYDPNSKVFKIMESCDKFPPEHYSSDDWLVFLRYCGLIHEVTQDKLIAYVKLIEHLGSDVEVELSEDMKNKSRILLEHILSHIIISHENVVEDNFLFRIKDIRFIEPLIVDKSLLNLHSQPPLRSAQRPSHLCSFNGLILACNEKLVWTVRNLLPTLHELGDTSHFFEKKEGKAILERLGVIVEPSVKIVATHTKTLCDELVARKASLSSTNISKVIKRIYRFLIANSPLNDVDKFTFGRVPCILIPDLHVLIRPNQLSISITEDQQIQPYLFKLPLVLGEFNTLFMELGATEKISACQYAEILKTIHRTCERGESLHAEERVAVRKVVHELFLLLEKRIEAKSDDECDLISELFLPCTDKKLHRCNETIFIDKPHLEQRAGQNLDRPVLINMSEFYLDKVQAETILSSLSPEMRPQFFSEVIQEQFDTCCIEVDCLLARQLKARMESTAFANGFERLIRHSIQIRSTVSTNVMKAELINEIVQEFLTRARLSRFIGHERVVTKLMFENRYLENSALEKKFFFENVLENGVAIPVIHITSCFVADPAFNTMLTKALVKSNKHKLSNIELLVSNIVQCDLNDISNILDNENIKELGNDSQQTGCFIFPLGSIVPINFHHLLIQDHFHFYKGQHVALEQDDPADHGSDEDATYILVEIIEKVIDDDYDEESTPSDLATRYKIKIDIYGTELVVMPNLLYSFDIRGEINDENARLLVVYKRNKDDQPQVENELFGDFTKTIRKIKALLIDAWSLPQKEKKIVIRRLLLAYHPDKHPPEQKDFYTKVFQRLQNLLERLSRGESIDDPANEKEDESAAERASAAASAERFWQNDGFGFGTTFFHNMGKRARRHGNRRHHYQQNYSQGRGGGWRESTGGGSASGGGWLSTEQTSGRRDYERFFGSFTTEANPQPPEARRWMKQARYDMTSAVNDGVAAFSCTAFEWMAYKCYRAAEKALHAAQIATDVNIAWEAKHRLDSYCGSLNDLTLNEFACQLTNLLKSSDHTQSPAHHPTPQVPHDVFTEATADKALELCEKIVELCSRRIDQNLD